MKEKSRVIEFQQFEHSFQTNGLQEFGNHLILPGRIIYSFLCFFIS